MLSTMAGGWLSGTLLMLSDVRAVRRARAIWIACALMGGALTGASQAPTDAPSTLTVHGRVVNALTGSPVPRALVNLNGRAVLTDALGQFEFPDFSNPAATGGSQRPARVWVQVTKPGYASALDANEAMGQQAIRDVTVPLELKLYPDGLITGTVTAPDGEPLAKVQLSISREMGDEGVRRVQPIGFTMTDSHGEYRFEEQPGRYRLALRYAARSGDTGEAILPQHFPDAGDGAQESTFAVGPGEQRKIDLQAKTGIAYPVTFQVDEEKERPMGVRLVVRPSSGSSFAVFPQPTRSPGEFRIELPAGTYQVTAVQQQRERRLEAESRVTVTNRPVAGLLLHFSEMPTIPVQVVADTSSSASATTTQTQQTAPAQPPSPMNLNLRLQKIGEVDDDGSNEIRLAMLPDKSFGLIAGSGTYRLAAQNGGPWFIEKATYGTTDLLRENLTVAPGAAGEPIQIVVSNGTGQVTGTVRSNGAGGTGYVYLLPHEPSLTLVYTAVANADGTFTETVPPGNYSVVAFDHRFPGDLRDPQVLAQLRGGGSAQVTPGGKASVDLDLQPVEAVR